MEKVGVGTKIKIVEMVGEPKYAGRLGVVTFIDDAGQIFGTWGGCAIIPQVDKIEILDK